MYIDVLIRKKKKNIRRCTTNIEALSLSTYGLVSHVSRKKINFSLLSSCCCAYDFFSFYFLHHFLVLFFYLFFYTKEHVKEKKQNALWLMLTEWNDSKERVTNKTTSMGKDQQNDNCTLYETYIVKYKNHSWTVRVMKIEQIHLLFCTRSTRSEIRTIRQILNFHHWRSNPRNRAAMSWWRCLRWINDLWTRSILQTRNWELWYHIENRDPEDDWNES